MTIAIENWDTGPARKKSRRPSFPRLPLFVALAFIAFSVSAIIFGEHTGIGTVKFDGGSPSAIRDIVITQGGDSEIVVSDAIDGSQIVTYGANEGSFVRGSLRAFDRMRLVANTPASTPYRLIRWENGAISLSDTGSGERYYLNAFGPDNAAAFARLLEPRFGN